jgi:hypothetical protein
VAEDEEKKNRGGRRPGEGWPAGKPRLAEGPIVQYHSVGLTQRDEDLLVSLLERWGLGRRDRGEVFRRALRIAAAAEEGAAEEGAG